MMNSKLRPALIGGVVLGLLSALPLVNAANLCCCVWALVGGALASYLYIKRSAAPVSAGEGALLGLIAGGIGTLIYIVLGVPLSLLVNKAATAVVINILQGTNPEQAEFVRQYMEQTQNQPLLQTILLAILVGVLLTIFSTIGGLIAVPLFKRQGGAGGDMPPPLSSPPYSPSSSSAAGVNVSNIGSAPPPSSPSPPNFTGRSGSSSSSSGGGDGGGGGGDEEGGSGSYGSGV